MKSSPQQEIMRNELLRILNYISNLFKKNDIPFWLTCGTLLGAVRTGKLIPWDNDIDIGIWESDAHKIINNLELIILADGFGIEHVQESISSLGLRYKEWGCLEDWNPIKYSQSDIIGVSYRMFLYTRHLDIRYTVINKGMAFSIAWPHNRCPFNDLQNLEEIEFEGKMYSCPRNPEEFLRINYGEDWKTPKIEPYMILRLSEEVLKKYADKISSVKLMPPRNPNE